MNRESSKRNRSRSQNRNLWLVVALAAVFVVLIVVAIILPSLFDQDPTQPPSTTVDPNGSTQSTNSQPESMKELIIQSVTEEGALVLVTTTYGNFSYPFAYSDLMVINTISEDEYVAFSMCANIGDVEPVYNIWINHAVGTYAGVLTVDGETYPVYVEFIAPRENLDSGDLQSFFAAQETLNDVFLSWAANGFYTPMSGENNR